MVPKVSGSSGVTLAKLCFADADPVNVHEGTVRSPSERKKERTKQAVECLE